MKANTLPLFRHCRWSHLAIVLMCAALAIGVALLLNVIHPSFLEPLELATVDLRFRIRSPLPVSHDPSQLKSDRLIAIDYDDRAARAFGLGRWPWDRRVHAQVFDVLKKAGVQAVMIDLLFDHESDNTAEDRALVEATRRAGFVIYPVAFRTVREQESSDTMLFQAPQHLLHAEVNGGGDMPGGGDLTLPFPALVAAANGLGHIQRTPDTHGGLRRIPLLYAVKGGFVPALSFVAALRLLEVDPGSVRIERGRSIRFTPRNADEVIIPIDEKGRTWINYAGAWGTRFLHYPYSWLVEQLRVPESKARLLAQFKGQAALLSNLTTGSGDRVMTPFEPDFPTSEVALHVLNMVLSHQFLRDATVRELILCLIGPVALLTVGALAGGPAVIIPTFAVILSGYLLMLHSAFSSGVILPAVQPLAALTTGLVLLLVARFFIVDRERVRFQTVLGACLPPQTIQVIRDNPSRIPTLLSGHSRELTVFFVDIQGFSSFCKRAEPLEIQAVLRDYLTAMTAVLRQRGGTLDKYMGDGIMAFFGDADSEDGGEEAEERRVEHQAASAVRAGIEMQRKMAELNAGWQSQGRETHAIRIGINTGIVTVGNLGTEYLWDYTVIGPEVNKAQRLERASEAGGLLLARRTYVLARKQGVLPDGLIPKMIALKGIGDEGNLYAVTPEMVVHLSGRLMQQPAQSLAS